MSIQSLFSLEGKTAVITGGSRGLGLYMAEAIILAGGAKVYISSRKQKACEEAANYINDLAKKNGLKGQAIPLAADLGKREGAEYLAAEIAKKESKLDILIANAGASWGEDFEKHPPDAIDKVLNLNLKGVFFSIQLLAPLLENAGTAEDPARVIITGSTAGLTAGLSGGTYGYLASKAGVHHLGKSLAVELGPRNITVNMLAPGFFPSKMSNGLLEVIGDAVVGSNPRGRLGVKEDIIGATIYLLSKAGNYANGVVLPLDGGSHLNARM